jgi:hypothetical protein
VRSRLRGRRSRRSRQLDLEGVAAEFPPLRSLRQTNLPVAAWPLPGRDPELAKIRSLVSEGVRLLTLTGAGGSGKTRLALQAAAELSEEFADGVFFVALAPLRDTAAVRATVAEAVGLQPDEDVAAWLASRRVLLVLDNLEHFESSVVGRMHPRLRERPRMSPEQTSCDVRQIVECLQRRTVSPQPGPLDCECGERGARRRCSCPRGSA